MSNKSTDVTLSDKIYVEASQWVRLANTIIWSMGTFLVPLSFGLIGVVLNKSPSYQFNAKVKVFLGLGSIFLFSFWVYVSFIYRRTSTIAREVLIKIEEEWGVSEEIALYTRHGLFSLKWNSLYNLQVFCLILLIMAWIVIWIFDS